MNCRLQRPIQNSVKNLRLSALQEQLMAFNDFQPLTIFTKHSLLDVWQSSEYASGLLKLFYPGSKRDTREYLLYIMLIIVFTQNFSLIWKYNIQANDAFALCFIFFIPMSQIISVIDRSGMCYFYTHQTIGACASICMCHHMHQMENSETVPGKVAIPVLQISNFQLIGKKELGAWGCFDFPSFIFLPGFSFTNIHKSEDSRGRG